MKTLKITNRFNTLAEAVEFAKPDLSYNPRSAAEDIELTDSGYNGRSRGVTHAFVTDDNAIYYVFEDSGIGFLHVFSPFVHCLHDGPLTIVCYDKQENALKWTDIKYPKTKEGRRDVRLLIRDTAMATSHPAFGGLFAN
jgi:hypothetical protein